MPHILVFDHDSDVCEVIRLALQMSPGVRVTSVGAVTAAWAAIARDQPDIAIIDVVMPRDGELELAIHATQRGIPVLLISGEPQASERLRAIGCPFLAKPFRVTELITETRLLLRDSHDHLRQVTRALQIMLSVRERIDFALPSCRPVRASAGGPPRR